MLLLSQFQSVVYGVSIKKIYLATVVFNNQSFNFYTIFKNDLHFIVTALRVFCVHKGWPRAWVCGVWGGPVT